MEKNKYESIYNEFQDLIQKEIDITLVNNQPINLFEPLQYLLDAGGKRLRPLLTIASAKLVGGSTRDALKPAIAVELLHNFSLIHDDIMDNAPIRRNKQTIHTRWNNSIAILSGDLLLAISFKKAIENFDEHTSNLIIGAMIEALIEICEGQGYDLEFETNRNVTLDDYLMMIEKKTAKLIENAMLIGGYVGRANNNELNLLRQIGNNIGMGFQIQDDLLDLSATTPKFGKMQGQDLKEGKKTYLFFIAKMQITDKSSLELLNKFLINKGLSEEDIPVMIEIFRKNGVFDIAKNMINEYYNKALNLLSNFPDNDNNEDKEFLEQLIHNIFERGY
ncbi:MAG TPA: polyprenyl synthetase family protein [Candidatus Kapabacteria bacterium]|nr:polyprenyl synthetase family protein [Candidatus Kapabacteria bacterium]HOV92775.1 polyprenyl synthetase family protein [Candidatus Kapabacteria bacterium]